MMMTDFIAPLKYTDLTVFRQKSKNERKAFAHTNDVCRWQNARTEMNPIQKLIVRICF